MTQLNLFDDYTDGSCSFVARPFGTTADGLHIDFGCSEVARPVSQILDGLNIDGATYEPVHDSVRLGKQALAVFELMRDGNWRTLREIVEAIGGGSEAGVSARLRDFRKDKFGGHVVNRRRRGEEANGVFEYQVKVK